VKRPPEWPDPKAIRIHGLHLVSSSAVEVSSVLVNGRCTDFGTEQNSHIRLEHCLSKAGLKLGRTSGRCRSNAGKLLYSIDIDPAFTDLKFWSLEGLN
jgi:hypothetical protein